MYQFLLLLTTSAIFLSPIKIPLAQLLLMALAAVVYFGALKLDLDRQFGKRATVYIFATDLRYNFPLLLATSIFVSLFIFVGADPDRMDIAIRRPTLYLALQDNILSAAYIVSVFVALFSFVANYLLKDFIPRVKPQLDKNLSVERMRSAFMAIYAISLLARSYAYANGRTNFTSETGYAEIFGPFGSFVSLISVQSLFIPAYLLVVSILYKDKTSLFVWALMIAAEFAYGGLFGIKSGVIFPIAFSFYGYYYAAGRLPKLRVLLPIALVAGAFTHIAYTSRNIALDNPRLKGGELLLAAVQESFSSLSATSDRNAGRPQDEGYWLSRMNVATPLLAAIHHVETDGFSGDGASYGNTLFSPVPSFVFPWKPDVFDVNGFGRAVGLIAPYDFLTAVRPSYLGDLYYTFGWWGITIGAVCLGILVSGVIKLMENYNICVPLYTMAFFLTMSDVENSIGNSFGGLIKVVLVLFVVQKFASRSESNLSKSAIVEH